MGVGPRAAGAAWVLCLVALAGALLAPLQPAVAALDHIDADTTASMAPLQADGAVAVTVDGPGGTGAATPGGTFTYFHPRIVDQPPAAVATADASFSFDAGGPPGATFTCSLDGEPALPCTSPVELTGVGDGAHIFSVWAELDGVASPEPAEAHWTAYLEPLVVTFDRVPPFPNYDDNHGAEIVWGTGGEATYVCSLDGALPTPCGDAVYYDDLAPGYHHFEVVATDPAGRVSAPAELTFAVGGPGTHPVTPVRILDSRTAETGFAGPLGPGATDTFEVAGVGAIPDGVTAVVLNLTVTGGTLPSYVVVHPSGSPPPTAANLVFAPGQTISNLLTVPVGDDGRVAVTNQLGSVHVVGDVVAYLDDGPDIGSQLYAAFNTRILDSRTGTGGWAAPLGPGEGRVLDLKLPVGATAALLTVTVTGSTEASYLQAFPTGSPQPVTASVLFGPGETRAATVLAPLGPDGDVVLFNQQGSVHVVADLLGWFDPAPNELVLHPLTPTRAVDSRTGLGGYDTPWSPGESRLVDVTGIPERSTAFGLVVNVTATGASDGTYLTLSGADPPPVAANLLVPPGTTVNNLTFTSTASIDGDFWIFNQKGSVDVVVDVVGYYSWDWP